MRLTPGRLVLALLVLLLPAHYVFSQESQKTKVKRPSIVEDVYKFPFDPDIEFAEIEAAVGTKTFVTLSDIKICARGELFKGMYGILVFGTTPAGQLSYPTVHVSSGTLVEKNKSKLTFQSINSNDILLAFDENVAQISIKPWSASSQISMQFHASVIEFDVSTLHSFPQNPCAIRQINILFDNSTSVSGHSCHVIQKQILELINRLQASAYEYNITLIPFSGTDQFALTADAVINRDDLKKYLDAQFANNRYKTNWKKVSELAYSQNIFNIVLYEDIHNSYASANLRMSAILMQIGAQHPTNFIALPLFDVEPGHLFDDAHNVNLHTWIEGVMSNCPDSKPTIASKPKVNLHPNPAQHTIYIDPPTLENYRFEIFNNSSQLQLKGTLKNNQIDVKSLLTGTYYIRLENKTTNTILIREFVKL